MAGHRLTIAGRPLLPLALGTVKIGRNRGVKYPEPFQLPDDRAVDALLEGALELGVRIFDTAPAYGSSESRLRQFVRRHRAQILISTKAGEDFDGDVSRHDFSAAAVRASCERSLRRLDCDVIDFLFLHSDGGAVEELADEQLLDTLAALRDEGKLRKVGLSAKTERGVRSASLRLDAVMAPYGLHARQLEDPLRDAHAMGRTVFAIKALASGHAASDGTVAAALEHVFAQDFVDAAVIGTLQLSHLREAVDAAKVGMT